MRKVGIVTTTYGNNFGEALQAFAMRKAINTYVPDCQAELVDFICGNQTSLIKPGFEAYEKLLVEKNALFQEFRKEEIGLSGFPSKVLNGENVTSFDEYVFGSDQIWNTDAWKVPEFFGSFVPEGKKKISFAASIGLKPDNPSLDLRLFQQYIKTYDFLSVREKDHCQFLKQFTDKEVYHVADPTLLLEAETYKKLFSLVKSPCPKRNYIFYYQPHSADGAIVSLVNKLARLYSMDVVHTFANIPKTIFPFDSISARFCGPREFLFYLYNASLVITRSYHAMVFSILFKKPFYVYVDKKTGSRFESLLTTIGLEDRLIYDYIKPEDVDFKIDYTMAYKKLDAFKKTSLDFLQMALK